MSEQECDHRWASSTQFSTPTVEIKRCTICGICEKTVSVLKSLWTTEKPTKPGWYFYRRDNNTSMLSVALMNKELGVMMTTGCNPLTGIANYNFVPLQGFPGEWAGPLQPPT
jgi:hypothetical protein